MIQKATAAIITGGNMVSQNTPAPLPRSMNLHRQSSVLDLGTSTTVPRDEQVRDRPR